jgi:hypothetical protein
VRTAGPTSTTAWFKRILCNKKRLPISIDGFAQETRTFKDETRVVYYRRTEGVPGVVLMHEIPGITPQVVALGTRLADAGFSVAMPSLFGEDGTPYSFSVATEVILKMCVSREFAVFAANGSSPIVDWLRALSIDFHAGSNARRCSGAPRLGTPESRDGAPGGGAGGGPSPTR